MDTLTADASKAAEEAKTQIDALTGEKDELAKQVETLTADAAKAAEDAQAQIDTMTADAAKAAEEAEKVAEEVAEETVEAAVPASDEGVAEVSLDEVIGMDHPEDPQ